MAGRRTEKQQLERDYVNVMQEEENIQLEEEESFEDWLAARYWEDYVREKEETARRQKYYY